MSGSRNKVPGMESADDELVAHYANGAPFIGISPYYQYWHGYQVIIRPLLSLFSYPMIRVLNGILQTVLLLFLCLLMRRNGLGRYILPYIASVLMLMPLALAMSLQFSSCYYILTLGREGIPEAAKNAVLNANYLQKMIKGTFEPAYDRICMHEFVLDLSVFKKETGVSALDVAKTLIDNGMHPPTMYFPLIVHEALMLEPTETESKDTLDWAAEVFRSLYELAHTDPEYMHNAPHNAQIARPDEVKAARNPILRYQG